MLFLASCNRSQEILVSELYTHAGGEEARSLTLVLKYTVLLGFTLDFFICFLLESMHTVYCLW